MAMLAQGMRRVVNEILEIMACIIQAPPQCWRMKNVVNICLRLHISHRLKVATPVGDVAEKRLHKLGDAKVI